MKVPKPRFVNPLRDVKIDWHALVIEVILLLFTITIFVMAFVVMHVLWLREAQDQMCFQQWGSFTCPRILRFIIGGTP